MKLTRMIWNSVGRRSGSRTARRTSLINAVRTGKHNRVVLAGIVAIGVAAAGAANAATSGVWHVPPQPQVRAICHAGDTLWVGTSAGLFRIDIRNGAPIDRIDAGPRLPSASVRGIATTGDSVFVTTDGGLSLFRGAETQVFTPREPGALAGVPLTRLSGVSIGRDREVLIGTLGLGAGILTPSGGYTITTKDSLLDDIVFSVADRPDGPRYFASPAGLCAQLDDTTFAWYQAGAGLPRGEVRHISVGADGGLYVLVSRLGLFRFDGTRSVQVKDPEGIRLRDALSMSAGADGALWVAGDGWVVVRRAHQWMRVPVAAPDDHARWRTIVADGSGAFAGSADGVVIAIGRGSAFRESLSGGLPSGRVASIAPDGTGRAWVVTGGSVVLADARTERATLESTTHDAQAVTIDRDGAPIVAGRWTVHRRDASGWVDMSPDVVDADPAFTAARVDADGRLWVGMSSGALYRYDGEIWLRMARSPGDDDGAGVADVRSARGGAWALFGGVPVRPAAGGLDHYAGIDSTDRVVDLKRTPTGTWVAVTASRLYRFDEPAHRWEPVFASVLAGTTGNAEHAVDRPGVLTSIAFDARGRVFLGSTGGVGIVDTAGERWRGAVQGIGGDAVTSLEVDGAHLWIGFATDGLSVVSLDSAW